MRKLWYLNNLILYIWRPRTESVLPAGGRGVPWKLTPTSPNSWFMYRSDPRVSLLRSRAKFTSCIQCTSLFVLQSTSRDVNAYGLFLTVLPLDGYISGYLFTVYLTIISYQLSNVETLKATQTAKLSTKSRRYRRKQNLPSSNRDIYRTMKKQFILPVSRR